MPVSEPNSTDNDASAGGRFYCGKFPLGFKFGTSTIAHQIEGTWDDDGKGLSMWDEASQSHPKCVADRTTADKACNSYHKFQTDVLLLKCMHANTYNFSLNWSRILPDGTLDKINQKGIDYYDDLINTLLENGIEPIVTIHHWDMPQALLTKCAGGWLNEGLVSAFGLFAKLCFQKFGDRVQQWISIAQPWVHSWKGYGSGVHPPNLCLGNKGAFLANTNLLKAHAKVYRLYESEFKESQGGRVGIAFSCGSDEEGNILQLGRELYPLVNGEYPQCFVSAPEVINNFNCTQISSDWTPELKGSFDFIALQFSPDVSSRTELMGGEHFRAVRGPDASIQTSAMRNLCNIIKTEFRNPEVLIFCTGPPLSPPFQMMDTDRAQYFNQTANEILKAIDLDGCNITGFFPGKLMDCWEWDMGYTLSYGLHKVDFQHSHLKRSPRASVAFMLKGLFKDKQFQEVDSL